MAQVTVPSERLQKIIDNPNNMILLFDGVCNLCNGSIDYLINHNPQRNLFFLSLQSEEGCAILKANGLGEEHLKTFVAVSKERIYLRSTAVLKAAKKTKGAMPFLASVSLIFPEGLRNWVYNIVAANRYKWFGEKETCRLPTAEERDVLLG